MDLFKFLDQKSGDGSAIMGELRYQIGCLIAAKGIPHKTLICIVSEPGCTLEDASKAHLFITSALKWETMFNEVEAFLQNRGKEAAEFATGSFPNYAVGSIMAGTYPGLEDQEAHPDALLVHKVLNQGTAHLEDSVVVG